jgi:hypothetical protein
MTDSKTYKVMLVFEGGAAGHCGAIDFEGAIWLVPKWLPYPSEGYTKPERMIQLDQFRHQRFDPPATGPGPFAGADFALSDPLPKLLFFGDLSQQLRDKYAVRTRPDVMFRTAGNLS